MTKDDMTLLSQLRAAINKKELSGEYEIIDDTITADALDAESDAMLSEVNERLLRRISPYAYEELPPRAKLLMQQLNQLYVKLYTEINTGTNPGQLTVIMRMLKKVLPSATIAGLISGAVTYMLKQNTRQTIYAFLGWLFGTAVIGTSYTTLANMSEQLPEEAFATLQEIRGVEEELKRYGVTFTPIIAKIPSLG